MNVDHLYFGKRKASEDEEAAMKAPTPASRPTCSTAMTAIDDRVAALLAKGHAARAAATFAGPMDFGADYDEISIADFKSAADLEPNYFTREGFGALVARFGADVPVELSTPVRRIRWDVPGVACETDRGTIRAKAVIVTSSPAVLAFEEIDFTPDLPDACRGLLRPADGHADQAADREYAARGSA
jgi:monoamine oxidase